MCRRAGIYIITYFVSHVISIRPKTWTFREKKAPVLSSLLLHRVTLSTMPYFSWLTPRAAVGCHVVVSDSTAMWRQSGGSFSFSCYIFCSLIMSSYCTKQSTHTKHAVHNKTSQASTQIFHHFHRKTLQQQHKHTQTNRTPITMLTSGVFNRNDSAQYFVNMTEHGVCSLHGLLLSLLVIDMACCCGNTKLYFDCCQG